MENITTGQVIMGLIAAVQALLLYIWKKESQENQTTRQLLMEHISACNETPNSTILNKIENLSNSINLRDTHQSGMLAAVNAELVSNRGKMNEMVGKIGSLEATVNLLGK